VRGELVGREIDISNYEWGRHGGISPLLLLLFFFLRLEFGSGLFEGKSWGVFLALLGGETCSS